MNRRSPGLTWLDSNDHKQRKWAHKYLQGKGAIDQQRHPLTNDELLQIGEELESTREGILIIEQMKTAWRQVKCSASDSDRKTYAFKLKIDVKKELAWLAKKSKITAADMLDRLISGELDAHVRFETKLNEEKKKHKELLRNSRNNTAHYRETNRTLRELLDVSIARLCRSEILLEDAALSTGSITEEQQRRIDKRCKQIMADAVAVVKGQSALLPGELFNHAIPVGDSIHALKEAATESPFCSQKSSTDDQSSSTEYTFRIDSERLPLPEDHSEPTFMLGAAPHGLELNNREELHQGAFPRENTFGSLVPDAPYLESQLAPQSLPGCASTDITIRSNKVTLQRKKHTVIRGAQRKLEDD